MCSTLIQYVYALTFYHICRQQLGVPSRVHRSHERAVEVQIRRQQRSTEHETS